MYQDLQYFYPNRYRGREVNSSKQERVTGKLTGKYSGKLMDLRMGIQTDFSKGICSAIGSETYLG
jgi:hypothetical protein